jgi:ABC-type sugar transport system substrate-binding protein
MSKLFQSRKFLLLVIDAVFAIAALAIGFFLVDDVALQAFIAAIFLTLQPVFVGAVNAIAVEDAAAYAAGIHPNQEGSVGFQFPSGMVDEE